VGAYRDKATYECYPCGTVAASLAGLLGLVAVGSLVVAGIVGATLASSGSESAIDIKIAQIALNHCVIVSIAANFPLEWPPCVQLCQRQFVGRN
jgi:hypothetical protein